WIRSRTGITKRHIASDGEYTSHMALAASLEAIKDANIDKSSIDLIIVCTTSPDNSFPSVATKLQGYLGLSSIPSFDLQAVCAGFVYGLHVADAMMKASGYNTVLLVGADLMSSLLNWQDRGTCILFGDGAGAVILKQESGSAGIISSKIYSDGNYVDILYTDGGVSMNGKAGVIKMQGSEVFKHAVEKMTSAASALLEESNLSLSDISYFVPHQANIRILDAIAKNLGIEDERVVKTVGEHANCSAASVPMALTTLKKSGKLKKGDIVMTIALGAGLTWGAGLIQW
ncbi:MAG: beta-ketoacyl-ACP synthase III, partial [Pseudomonadota bacterium]